MKVKSVTRKLLALTMLLALLILAACTGQNEADSEAPSEVLSSNAAPSSKVESASPPSNSSSESLSEAPQHPASSLSSPEDDSEAPQRPVSSAPSSENQGDAPRQESSAISPNDSPVTQDEPIETAVEITGNPTPDDFRGENFFVYDDLVCIRADSIEWVTELRLTKGDMLGEIIRTGITEDYADWDATDLPVGTQIFQHSERNEVLIAIYDSTEIPYLKMIEG